MSTRGNLYQKLIGGQNLNVADLLLENYGNVGKSVERIIVDCNTVNGLPIAITLPQVSDLGPATNFELLVKDSGGNAAAANITITRGGLTDKINGGTNTIINTANGGALFLVSTVKTGGSGWTAFNLSQIVPVVNPTQKNTVGVIQPGNTFTLAPLPLNTQHLIVSVGRQFLTVGTDYTVDYLTGVITFIFGAPGDPCNIYYSHN